MTCQTSLTPNSRESKRWLCPPAQHCLESPILWLVRTQKTPNFLYFCGLHCHLRLDFFPLPLVSFLTYFVYASFFSEITYAHLCVEKESEQSQGYQRNNMRVWFLTLYSYFPNFFYTCISTFSLVLAFIIILEHLRQRS